MPLDDVPISYAGDSVAPGEGYLADTPVLRPHAGTQPDLFLRWNEVPKTAAAIDVVVHLHGFSQQGGEMPLSEKVRRSGLELSGRERPTLALITAVTRASTSAPPNWNDVFSRPPASTRHASAIDTLNGAASGGATVAGSAPPPPPIPPDVRAPIPPPVTALPASAMRIVRVMFELEAMVAKLAGDTWP